MIRVLLFGNGRMSGVLRELMEQGDTFEYVGAIDVGDIPEVPHMPRVADLIIDFSHPNMLPVAMTAVDYEGKDRGEISSFVSDELINKLEGVDGVDSVRLLAVE